MKIWVRGPIRKEVKAFQKNRQYNPNDLSHAVAKCLRPWTHRPRNRYKENFSITACVPQLTWKPITAACDNEHVLSRLQLSSCPDKHSLHHRLKRSILSQTLVYKHKLKEWREEEEGKGETAKGKVKGKKKKERSVKGKIAKEREEIKRRRNETC